MGIETIIGGIFSFMLNMFIMDNAEFFAHKNKMERLYGPCEWKYVGKQTNIKNPAITLNPPVGENYVLFRQVCENDPHRKDKDKVSKTNQ